MMPVVLNGDSAAPAATLTCIVTNTGNRASDVTVLAFMVGPNPGKDGNPIKSLVGFERVHSLAPGQKATVTFPVLPSDLSYVNAAGKFETQKGIWKVMVEDSIQEIQRSKNSFAPNDRQLAAAPIDSPEGKKYMASMHCAANFAFVNRSLMAMNVRSAFERVLKKSARDLDMGIIYDVAHNIAKIEDHVVNGEKKRVLVHRKGATRAFPPFHPEIPEAYKKIGQPVIIGGSMGTNSYILLGTEQAMQKTFGSTCHGAGRILSRSQAMREIKPKDVLATLREKGIAIRVGDTKLIPEEASEAYKDITEVVQTCHEAGFSKLCVKLRPLIVIKG